MISRSIIFKSANVYVYVLALCLVYLTQWHYTCFDWQVLIIISQVIGILINCLYDVKVLETNIYSFWALYLIT